MGKSSKKSSEIRDQSSDEEVKDQGTRIEDQEKEALVFEEIIDDQVADQKVDDKDQGSRIEYQEPLVYDLDSLWSMRFRDPISGTTCMVRKAFKPRGKLELYCPEK